MKAMVFAAGLGSRLKPWTDHHPKALAIVNGKSLLQRNIEYLQTAGVTEVVVNVHHFAEQIIQALQKNNGWGCKVQISDESEELLDTGGGLMKAAQFFLNEPSFLAMNADILTDLSLKSFLHHHERSNAMATLAVSNRKSNRAFLFDENQTLVGWRQSEPLKEKIVRSSAKQIPMAFSGLHVINPAIFTEISLEGKFSMVDVYLSLANHCTITGFDHSGSRFIDVGKPGSIEMANEIFP